MFISVYSVLCEFSILTTYIAEPKRNKKDIKETAIVYLGWLHEVIFNTILRPCYGRLKTTLSV